jgi:hypothetical protein
LLAGVSEGGEGVARSLLRGDVVLLVPLVGDEGQCGVGSAVRPCGGGLELAGATGDDVRAWENEIGWAWEHQWVVAVL